MQDERPGVDLGKRDDPVELAHKNEHLGAQREDGRWFAGTLLIAVLLLIVILIVSLVTGHTRQAALPPPIAPVVAPRIERVHTVGPEVQQQADPAEEAVDPLETARNKICRSIASEFVDASSPTQEQMRRTLTLYNLNECSNRYIRDKDAERRGLDKAELDAIQDQDRVGPLRLEDR